MNDLKNKFQAMPEVARLKELESFIDSNEKLAAKLKQLKLLQKQMVNAKEFKQVKQYQEYKRAYDQLNEEIMNFPFVEEYLELLDIVNQRLLDVADIITNKINRKIHEEG